MSDGTILELGKNAVMIMLLLSAPMLGVGLLIGLIVSMFQAATQINEMTLSFVPKVLGIIAALALFGPWMMTHMIDYTTTLFNTMAVIATK
jgi:flagellar biosynthetic protein FliQ